MKFTEVLMEKENKVCLIAMVTKESLQLSLAVMQSMPTVSMVANILMVTLATTVSPRLSWKLVYLYGCQGNHTP